MWPKSLQKGNRSFCRSQAMFLSCILAFNTQGKSGGRNLEIEGCRF